MRRATQWQPLCEADPTPGEPDEVRRAGTHYSKMAKEIEEQVTRLNDIVGGTLQGGYVQSLTEAADALKEDLGHTVERYREVGGALEDWASTLDGFQDEAEGLRRQASVAAGAMFDNRAVPTVTSVDAPPPADAEVAAAKAMQGRYDDASGDLSRLQGRLIDLTERRDTAAAKIADVILDKSNDGKDGFGDNFKDWMDANHELVSGVCKVLGVIAMAACVVALVVPGLGVGAAAALFWLGAGASAGSLLGHTAIAATHNGPWTDVGIDAFALATLGAGRVLGPGLKVSVKGVGSKQFGGALERLTGEAKAAGAEARGNAARAPIQARINADVAKAQERLVGGASKRVTGKVGHQVKAIRLQGGKQSQEAFNSAKNGYNSGKTVTTLEQRVGLGGGDRDLATLRVQAQDAARGFASTSKVGLAAAKADAQYVKALIPTTAANAATPLSFVLEATEPSWYVNLRERSITREGGDL